MRNKLILLIGCICLFILVGCSGSKTLTCSSTEGVLSEKMMFTFENNSISKVKIIYISTQESASEAENKKDALTTLITATYGTPDYSNYELDVEVSGSKIIGTLNIDYSKCEDTLKKVLSSGTTYKEIKKEYKDSGSTCK